MQPEQQRILGYFIEEAKEHLQTIESALLDLPAVMNDPERLNEVFRAAHSVKGGAAMLGIHSMQSISHRLEDYFKVLKEHPVTVDQKLEGLFFKGFDALNHLTEELQANLSLPDAMAAEIMAGVEPVFEELQAHLIALVGPGVDLSELLSAVHAPAPEPKAEPVADPEAVTAFFRSDVLAQLRRLLQCFQQADTADNRRTLAGICQTLAEVGQAYRISGWQAVCEVAQTAIEHSDNSFAALAPVIIPELKTARDLVLNQRAADVLPSEPLTALVPAIAPADDWLGLFGDAPASAATTEVSDLDFLFDDFGSSSPAAPMLSGLAPLTTAPAPLPAPDFAALASLLTEPEPTAPTPMVVPEITPVPEPATLGPLPLPTIPSPALPTPAVAAVGGRQNQRANNQTMKVAVKQLDSLSNLIGELVVNRNTLEDNQDRLRQFLENLMFQVQQLNDLGQQMQDLYERSLLESSLLVLPKDGSGNRTAMMADATEDDSHATGVQFDALEMDRFTGFHTLAQEMIERIVRVREATSDIEFIVDSNEQVSRMFRQVTGQVQEGLTRSRMVPFSQVAERLPRAVRDISIKCGKQAHLELEGMETLIDKGILERLYDPLTHLVNNAIYHGIEAPEVRRSMAKEAEGIIKIRAFYQGNQTVISITDDGGGIDLDRVRQKAIAKGLITPDVAAQLSRQDTFGLLFQPGFSTNDQADDLAGRGVGMDVVRTCIQDIRGVINTDSTLGKGTTFTIRLPLTLSITKALCCVDQTTRIAFPIDGVEDMIDLAPSALPNTDEPNAMFQWRDQQLPLKTLSNLFAYQRPTKRSSSYGAFQDNQVSVIILRSDDDFIAVRVDEVLGEQEIVIKQLSGPVPKPLGIAGVTVQGDGRVMPIADVHELIQLSLDRLEITRLWDAVANIPAEETLEPLVLIVDDSITVRELLSATFLKSGYRVEQARDGLEAWEKLRSGLPCELVFCDVEMPRMDGLELLSRLQQDPDLQDLPVAMLTSRGATRHKQMAVNLGAKGYFTKPYMEEVLLDAAQRMLGGEVLVK